MICPMKFSTLANPRIISLSHELDKFMECHKELCAWYCTYPNGEGECSIHSLPGLFDGLQDIAGTINRK